MEAEFRSMVAREVGLPTFRVNWGEDPNGGTGSYVVLHLVSFLGGHTQQGPDALKTTRVQVDCYGDTWASARRMASLLDAALDGYRGGVFRAIFADGMRLTREGGAGSLTSGSNSGEAIYRASMDFITHWRTSDAG